MESFVDNKLVRDEFFDVQQHSGKSYLNDVDQRKGV